MYNALGPRWAASIPGFLALAFAPAPFLLVKYGQRIRRWTKYGREADDVVQRLAAAKVAAREAEIAAAAGRPSSPTHSEGAGADSLARGGARTALDDGEVEKEIVEEIKEARSEVERIRSRSASVRSGRSEASDGARSASPSMHTALEGRRTPLEPAHIKVER